MSLIANDVLATSVKFTDVEFIVDLSDGRKLSIPLVWFPRLLAASHTQRQHYEFIGGGEGIHWPDVDEDISVAGLLAGRPSFEFTGKVQSPSI
ncbi:MAG: DUF2442 domain-containing protein [Deinococcota bacterium]